MDLSTIEARKQIAGKWASQYGINMALLCGLIDHESTWNQWACRYEPGFYSRYIQPLIVNGTVTSDTEARSRSTSYGLCQTMGEVARELGFTGKFLTELCDPDVGIEFGCRKLKACLDKNGGNVNAALLAYNGGSDPSYPGAVLALVSKYE